MPRALLPEKASCLMSVVLYNINHCYQRMCLRWLRCAGRPRAQAKARSCHTHPALSLRELRTLSYCSRCLLYWLLDTGVLSFLFVDSQSICLCSLSSLPPPCPPPPLVCVSQMNTMAVSGSQRF
ncbi:hypothetical protein BU23DRAFT_89564 [Bimuria novae-zelandiae CBS 107.79]|uniref:Uncharacterized protein n=1 Tax=Bimuria novae-zelandiae CBS 107.79 TaxID=1447943 RepID=A0A6A5VEC0_9PLEO|nr:hypothetical protein BU23DRAFT_89564 [Bimuria novae-zelandiae CBS 107.79]